MTADPKRYHALRAPGSNTPAPTPTDPGSYSFTPSRSARGRGAGNRKPPHTQERCDACKAPRSNHVSVEMLRGKTGAAAGVALPKIVAKSSPAPRLSSSCDRATPPALRAAAAVYKGRLILTLQAARAHSVAFALSPARHRQDRLGERTSSRRVTK